MMDDKPRDDELKIIWDARKAASNKRKHKISFEEAATVFYDTLAITRDDPEHSQEEERFVTIGVSESERIIVISHLIERNQIHIISARKPTPSERADYEDES
jgi:uncharacterized DUF497 family protein